jgi:hypothetical protein
MRAQANLHAALARYERDRARLSEGGVVLPEIPHLPTTRPAPSTPAADGQLALADTASATNTSADAMINLAISEIDHGGRISPRTQARLRTTVTDMSATHKLEWITALTGTKPATHDKALHSLAELIATCG